MDYIVSKSLVALWCQAYVVADLKWFRPRKQLWTSFKHLLAKTPREGDSMLLTSDVIMSIRSTLLSKQPTEQQSYALDHVVMELQSQSKLFTAPTPFVAVSLPMIHATAALPIEAAATLATSTIGVVPSKVQQP